MWETGRNKVDAPPQNLKPKFDIGIFVINGPAHGGSRRSRSIGVWTCDIRHDVMTAGASADCLKK